MNLYESMCTYIDLIIRHPLLYLSCELCSLEFVLFLFTGPYGLLHRGAGAWMDRRVDRRTADGRVGGRMDWRMDRRTVWTDLWTDRWIACMDRMDRSHRTAMEAYFG